MNTIQIGPFVLNFELLIFLFSAFVGYWALKYRLKMASAEEKTSDKFVNALILGFLTWKFSTIIFDPVSVIQNPMSLIYFSGGDRGLWLAIVVSVIFLGVQTQKDGTAVMVNLDVLGTGWIVGSSIYYLLRLAVDSTNFIVPILNALVTIALLLWIYKKKEKVGHTVVLNQIVLWYSLGRISLSFLKERTYFLLGFSTEQLVYLALAFIALFVGIALEKAKHVK